MLSKNVRLSLNFNYLIALTLVVFFTTQIKSLSFKYPTAFTLSDGKIFVIHSLGIDICDPEYTTSNRTLNFSQEIPESNFAAISISKYSTGEFIIFIINRIYLFDENGNYKHSSNTLNSIYGEYYTLSAHKITKRNDTDYFYFLFGYIDVSEKAHFVLRLYYCSIDTSSNSINTIASKTIDNYNIIYNGLSCEFILYNQREYILCAYEIKNIVKEDIIFSVFSIEDGFFYFVKEYSFIISQIEFIKSTTKSMESKPFFCGLYFEGEFFCLIFDFYFFFNNEGNDIYFKREIGKKCLKEPFNIKTYYFQETGEYVFSCLTIDNMIQTTIYPKNMTKMIDIGYPSMRLQKNFSEYDKFYYSIIYSQIYKTYVVLTDIDNDIYHHILLIDEKEIVNNSENMENTEKYLEKSSLIKENDEKLEEENKLELGEKEKYDEENKFEEEEKCGEENKFEEKEKYGESVVVPSTNENFEDNIYCRNNNNFNEVIKGCDFLKCFPNFSEIGEVKNCSDCLYYINVCEKNGKYYYPKITNDLKGNNSLINCCCIPEGNYLYMNDSNLITKPCYSSCKICEKEGNIKYHNCIECKNDFKFKLNVTNYLNCYMNSEIHNFNNKSEIENIKEILLNSFESLQSLNGEAIEFVIENIIISLTNTHNQRNIVNKNKTTIDLGECENKLKQINKIPIDDSLYILKYDIKEEGMNIPKIEYEVYYPFSDDKITKLDLTVCKDMKIDVSLPISITDDLEKYNTSSDYYNDLCSKATSKVGTDITLKDRQKEFIDQNMTLCEEDCNLKDYDYKNEIAKCSCNMKISLPFIEDIVFDKNKLYKKFTDIKNIANLNLMKCYKKVLKKESLKKNYGFFIILIIIVIFFVILILFCFKYFSVLKNVVLKIVETKKYLSKIKNEKSNKSNNKINEQININRINKKAKRKSQILLNQNENKNNDILVLSNKNKKRKKRKTEILQANNLLNLNIKRNSINNENKRSSVANLISNQKYIDYKNILEFNDYELNALTYEKALINDKRTYIQYYISLLRKNHLVIFALYCNEREYNSQIIKIFLLFFFFAVHITTNTIFFGETSIHEILIEEGDFNFIYQLPQIIYSSLISAIIGVIIKYLSLSEDKIIGIKREKKIKDLDKRVEALFNSLKIRFTLFFILTFIFLLFFMYYITCFCCIYEHTQIHLIKDSMISFGLSLIYPFGIYLIPGIFRIPALRAKKKDKKYLYKLSLLIQKI